MVMLKLILLLIFILLLALLACTKNGSSYYTRRRKIIQIFSQRNPIKLQWRKELGEPVVIWYNRHGEKFIASEACGGVVESNMNNGKDVYVPLTLELYYQYLEYRR